MDVKQMLPGKDSSLPGKVADTAGDAVEAARTNPAFPVAGAFGFVLLLSALVRRLRRRQ